MTESTWILLCAVVVFLIASMVLLIYFIIWLYRLPRTILPLKKIIQIPDLSLKDNTRIMLAGFLPFMGYLFMPITMKRHNINDYYEMRYNYLRGRINSKVTSKADLECNAAERSISNSDLLIDHNQTYFDYDLPFNLVRLWAAAFIGFISLSWYLDKTTLIYSYISYYASRHTPSQQLVTFADVIIHTKTQIQLPIIESQFIQSAWWLLAAIISFNRALYWYNVVIYKRNKFDSRLV